MAYKFIESRGRITSTVKTNINGSKMPVRTWTELIPYLDFINWCHPESEDDNVSAIEYDATKKGYFVKALRTIKQGDQIFIKS